MQSDHVLLLPNVCIVCVWKDELQLEACLHTEGALVEVGVFWYGL